MNKSMDAELHPGLPSSPCERRALFDSAAAQTVDFSDSMLICQPTFPDPLESCSDSELLERMLSLVPSIDDARLLSERLLARFDCLGRILFADPATLEESGADDRRTMALFGVVRTLVARLAREDLVFRPVLGCSEALVKYLRVTMAYARVEQFRVLFLNGSRELIADEIQHRGTIDHTPVYPREVAKRALSLDASAIIIAHNHPSNNPEPSAGDIDVTRRLFYILRHLGIELVDHVIICRRSHSSLKTLGHF